MKKSFKLLKRISKRFLKLLAKTSLVLLPVFPLYLFFAWLFRFLFPKCRRELFCTEKDLLDDCIDSCSRIYVSENCDLIKQELAILQLKRLKRNWKAHYVRQDDDVITCEADDEPIAPAPPPPPPSKALAVVEAQTQIPPTDSADKSMIVEAIPLRPES